MGKVIKQKEYITGEVAEAGERKDLLVDCYVYENSKGNKLIFPIEGEYFDLMAGCVPFEGKRKVHGLVTEGGKSEKNLRIFHKDMYERPDFYLENFKELYTKNKLEVTLIDFYIFEMTECLAIGKGYEGLLKYAQEELGGDTKHVDTFDKISKIYNELKNK